MKYAGSLHILNVKCKEQPTSVYLNSVWIRYSLHKQIQIKVLFRFFQVRSMEGTKLSSMCFVMYKCHMDHMQIQSARNPANYSGSWRVWNDQMFFLKRRALVWTEIWWLESSQSCPLSPLSPSSEVRVYLHHHDLSVLGSKFERAPVDSEEVT